ncbi:GGDEF domain-containing protein [Motilimonas cestriensis]|uniref:diguanylate cyclase n=1 Tax=Motilimonas cestriensis TaxID=2742685 RepID=A0ABS8W4N5_9GAMM|nr:GGDEF domain-containing protein [Motilimonas cestriensis]MCE2593932.1 GGDEF domain-containing protein [Motilimonas cestriensis]
MTVMNVLNQASQALVEGDKARAIALCQQYIDENTNDAKKSSLGLRILSDIYFGSGKIETAIHLLEAAQAKLIHSADQGELLVVQNSLAQRYADDIRFEDAMNTWLAMAAEAANMGDIDHFIEGLIGIAQLLEVVSDHQRALQFYNKARDHYEGIQSSQLKLRINLCEVSCLIALTLYEDARQLLADCETQALLDGEFADAYMAELFVYHSQICRAMGQIDGAINLLEKARVSSERHKLKWISNKISLELGLCYSLIARADDAILLLKQTLTDIADLSLPMLRSELYEALSHAYDANGEYLQALACEEQAHAIAIELLSKVPVSELGLHCLRRFKRWEPKLDFEKTRLENAALKNQALSQQEVVSKLEKDVYIDPLTRLYNRRWLDVTFSTRKGPYAILVADADHFKSVNDEFSHQVGDVVLQELAFILQQSVRSGDFVARYGGEEFVILLVETQADKVVRTADRIRNQVEQHHWQDIMPGRQMTISIGMAIKTEQEAVDSVFERADKALYQSKHNGRNRVTFGKKKED